MSAAAVVVYLPLVMSFFFTHKSLLGVSKKCHSQLFYRPDLLAVPDPAADAAAPFSCNGPIAAPLAEVFPFYAELQTGMETGVFSSKVKLFFADKSGPNEWNKIYFKLNTTSSLLDTTQDSNEASILTLVTEPTSEVHNPGGRFHFEYHHADNLFGRSTACTNTSGPMRLCAKQASSNSESYCGPYNLAAASNCSEFGARVITGLLSPLYSLPMNQCSRFTI